MGKAGASRKQGVRRVKIKPRTLHQRFELLEEKRKASSAHSSGARKGGGLPLQQKLKAKTKGGVQKAGTAGKQQQAAAQRGQQRTASAGQGEGRKGRKMDTTA